MSSRVLMPKLTWTMTDGIIVKWLKKEGERVKKGEPLLEVESDKAIGEVKAFRSGILRKILYPEGSVVPITETIAIIAEEDEEIPKLAGIIEANMKALQRKELKEKMLEKDKRISPLAKKIAEEHKVDVTKIKGTGPGGKIVKKDTWKAIEQVEVAPPIAPPPGQGKVIPLTSIRKSIAEHMAYSAHTTARVTITMESDMTETVKLRRKLLPEIQKVANIRISYTDILVKATAMALREHPILNSMLENGQIRMFYDINVGVAIALEDGLIVPVIHNADRKSLTEVALTLKELTEKAKKGILSADELTGGTFTITNLGVYGVETFTPIINMPQSAILGVGRISEKPVVRNGEIVVRSTMPLSLTFDHRIVDGKASSKFLQRLKWFLESPPLLFGAPS